MPELTITMEGHEGPFQKPGDKTTVVSNAKSLEIKIGGIDCPFEERSFLMRVQSTFILEEGRPIRLKLHFPNSDEDDATITIHGDKLVLLNKKGRQEIPIRDAVESG